MLPAPNYAFTCITQPKKPQFWPLTVNRECQLFPVLPGSGIPCDFEFHSRKVEMGEGMTETEITLYLKY